jgi:hypothetical protein
MPAAFIFFENIYANEQVFILHINLPTGVSINSYSQPMNLIVIHRFFLQKQKEYTFGISKFLQPILFKIFNLLSKYTSNMYNTFMHVAIFISEV